MAKDSCIGQRTRQAATSIDGSVTDDTQFGPVLARLNAALEWAAETVRSARLNSSIWCPVESDSAIRPIDKMVLEAALLALVAGRCPGARGTATKLIKEVAKQTEVAGRIYDLIRWRPHLRTSLGLLWLTLDEFDCGDIKQRKLLRELWQVEPFPSQPHERSPYRLLDQAWVSSKVRGEIDPAIAKGRMVPFTSLGNIEGAPFMHRNDLYALTHTAMYITDFGQWSSPDKYSSEIINSIGLSRLMQGDFDLAAELALADILVGDKEADVGQVIVRTILNDTFDALGHVPSPTFKQSEFLQADDPETYLQYNSYHTTFVYALLCLGVLTDQSRPLATLEPSISRNKIRKWDAKALDPLAHPIPNLGDLVAKQTHEWALACEERGCLFDVSGTDLLRRVLDGHLIRAVNADHIDDLIQLLGMSKIAGDSEVETLVCAHVRQRTRLASCRFHPETVSSKIETEVAP